MGGLKPAPGLAAGGALNGSSSASPCQSSGAISQMVRGIAFFVFLGCMGFVGASASNGAKSRVAGMRNASLKLKVSPAGER